MIKSVFTIPASDSFLDVLASGIWNMCEGDGMRLSQCLVLLPTRRACRNLGLAFSRLANGKPVLLPRMRPLGEVDEDEMIFADAAFPDIPPAISPMRRLFLLARQVKARDGTMSWDQAVMAAEALADFLDQIQIERCDLGMLPLLVEEQELAEHWQQTLKFLEIVTRNWPEILASQGCIGPSRRRDMVMSAQAKIWRETPPAHPVIAAGSTGSIPSTAELLDTIASMRQGHVVLPGLDIRMDNEAWDEVGDTHPQHSMKNLLKKMGVNRNDVKLWNGSSEETSLREKLISEAMRPASVTEAWMELRGELDGACTKGLYCVEAEHPQEEAQIIALRLREALENNDKTAALVTADRALAKRVAAVMRRWGIDMDDSGGSPLAHSPAGSFLNLVLAAASPFATKNDLLALLKHPHSACGEHPAACRANARKAEVRARKEEPEDFGFLKSILAPLTENWDPPLPLRDRIELHRTVAEAIARSDSESGSDRLWKFDDGEDAACWLDEWREATNDFPELYGEDYAALFASLSRSKIVRSRRPTQSRVIALGPLEARMCDADIIILGGMNEGCWPPDAGFDPWMSRPMRKKFNLPSPEFRIGLSAHDFAQLACAKEVMITRSLRVGGAPSVPSRFLLQLRAVLRAAGLSDDEKDALATSTPWREWAKALDAPAKEECAPCPRPQPRPPVDARPKSLSVTEISTWLRNPYAIYAKHVLKLRKLEELDADPDASDRGTMIHAALERFVKSYPDIMPDDGKARLMEIWNNIIGQDASLPSIRAFWTARFSEVADWFIEQETKARSNGIRTLATEAKGKKDFGGFVLTGRADRIDANKEETIRIVDYKTGAVPKKNEVEAGIEPQLQLMALIARDGGFEKIPPQLPESCEYWELKKESKIIGFDKELPELVEHAEIGLENLIATFSNPDVVYEASPRPRHQPKHDDYAHLSRIAEWARAEGED